MKNINYYYFQVTIAEIFWLLGGIHWIKRIYQNKSILIVLNYHNFSRYNNYKIKRGNKSETGYENIFDKQIKFFKKHFNFCYPNEYFNSTNDNIGLLITFDDGYKDNFDIAFPILKKHNAKCVFFITTDLIGTKKWFWYDKLRFLVSKSIIKEKIAEKKLKMMNRGIPVSLEFENSINQKFDLYTHQRIMMNWEEVRDIVNAGFKVGSHTANHKILSMVGYSEQKEEIEKSLTILTKRLNIKPNLFAYPNGLYNESTISLLVKNDIEYAFTTLPGVNLKMQEKLKIKRIGINVSDSIPILLLKIFLNIRK